MANFLKDQDVYNAINLDGGGSATLVLNETLASYPSDHWYVLKFQFSLIKIRDVFMYEKCYAGYMK